MSRKKQGVRNTTKTIIAIHDASPGCKTEQKASSENFFVARPILPPGSPCRPDAQHLVAPPAKETGFPFTGVVTKFSSVLDTWSGATFLDRQAENKAKRLDHDHAWRGQHANWVEKHLTSVKEEQKQDLAKRIKKIAHQRREAAEGGSCWRRKVLSDGLGEQEREDVADGPRVHFARTAVPAVCLVEPQLECNYFLRGRYNPLHAHFRQYHIFGGRFGVYRLQQIVYHYPQAVYNDPVHVAVRIPGLVFKQGVRCSPVAQHLDLDRVERALEIGKDGLRAFSTPG